MKYFITGILGHVAPHLVKLLISEGHEIHALIRGSNGNQYNLLDIMSSEEIESITFHYGDLLDYSSIQKVFKENKFDGMFHLAAMSHPPTSFKYPIGTMNINTRGTIYLIEAIKEYNPECIIMNCSTSEVYGNQCKETSILIENMALKPNNPYGWSKMSAETYLAERCNNKLVKGFSTRAFSHLAPRRGKNFSISWDAYHLALMKIGKTQSMDLPVGNLKTKRIVIDARDVVRAYYLLMKNFNEKINGESFNVCGAIETVKEMEFFTNKLIEISELKGVKKVIDKRVWRPIDIQIQVGDTHKLHLAINWSADIPIEQTLKNVFDYWVKKLK